MREVHALPSNLFEGIGNGRYLGVTVTIEQLRIRGGLSRTRERPWGIDQENYDNEEN
jgi:hypothetical protein